jgi:hypothetical protein
VDARKISAGAVRVQMLGAEHLLVDRQRALVERPRSPKVTLIRQQAGEVVEACRRTGVLGAEHLLVDRQRAFEQRFGLRKLALIPQQDGEVVVACRRFEYLGRCPTMGGQPLAPLVLQLSHLCRI